MTETSQGAVARTGSVRFCAIMLVVSGLCQGIAGVTALVRGDFYVEVSGDLVGLSLPGWGWVHVVVAVLLVLTGIGMSGARRWAQTAALVIAGLSLLGSFLFLPWFPWWSVVIIGLDVLVLWALARVQAGW
ncbi:hypothetical protein FPZ12_028155 [Amycolatopsis acidicola]|uniref:DUF7144 domain-containing protein n=1 Tax=Amycolatopsis acidicola TaxID=2596893 RepID=A0A5N0UW55_9PSEU|nr:hypothetical protein [Amycolatopsis acidicola]KAA9156201.1 hypothetical protein FPZ12_028155 [Amycolatopsis acidicola]